MLGPFAWHNSDWQRQQRERTRAYCLTPSNLARYEHGANYFEYFPSSYGASAAQRQVLVEEKHRAEATDGSQNGKSSGVSKVRHFRLELLRSCGGSRKCDNRESGVTQAHAPGFSGNRGVSGSVSKRSRSRSRTAPQLLFNFSAKSLKPGP